MTVQLCQIPRDADDGDRERSRSRPATNFPVGSRAFSCPGLHPTVRTPCRASWNARMS